MKGCRVLVSPSGRMKLADTKGCNEVKVYSVKVRTERKEEKLPRVRGDLNRDP